MARFRRAIANDDCRHRLGRTMSEHPVIDPPFGDIDVAIRARPGLAAALALFPLRWHFRTVLNVLHEHAPTAEGFDAAMWWVGRLDTAEAIHLGRPGAERAEDQRRRRESCGERTEDVAASRPSDAQPLHVVLAAWRAGGASTADLRRAVDRAPDLRSGEAPHVAQPAQRAAVWQRCLTPHHALRPLDVCDKPLTEWADLSWRCPDGHFNAPSSLRREFLGRLVREVWVVWARDQEDPKPHHLAPWDALGEGDREVDRRIGETLLGIRDWRIGQWGKDGRNPERIRERGSSCSHSTDTESSATGTVSPSSSSSPLQSAPSSPGSSPGSLPGSSPNACVVGGCENDHAGAYALCPVHLASLVPTSPSSGVDPRLDVLEAAERICRERAEEYATAGRNQAEAAAEQCADEIAAFANTLRGTTRAGVIPPK